MSVFFFRLHNLRREEESRKKRRRKAGSSGGSSGGLCGGGGGTASSGTASSGGDQMLRRSNLTLTPSRLFEKTPLTPSDSLDEVAFKIPRYSNNRYNSNRVMYILSAYLSKVVYLILYYFIFNLLLCYAFSSKSLYLLQFFIFYFLTFLMRVQ